MGLLSFALRICSLEERYQTDLDKLRFTNLNWYAAKQRRLYFLGRRRREFFRWWKPNKAIKYYKILQRHVVLLSRKKLRRARYKLLIKEIRRFLTNRYKLSIQRAWRRCLKHSRPRAVRSLIDNHVRRYLAEEAKIQKAAAWKDRAYYARRHRHDRRLFRVYYSWFATYKKGKRLLGIKMKKKFFRYTETPRWRPLPESEPEQDPQSN